MLYIIIGVIVVFFAWMQAATGKMNKYKNQARSQWVRINASLQTRSQYILELLELADESGLDAEDQMAEIYELKGGYSNSDDREVISERAEKVTPLLDQFLESAKQNAMLESSEEFQELKDELAELEEELELQSERYNQSIDLYNKHLEKPGLRLQFIILGPPHLRGIHIRKEDLPQQKI